MRELCFRGVRFPESRSLIMAIINRTPDSFFDGGRFVDDTIALAAIGDALTEGADIIDIGGVKSDQGSFVDEAEEMRRVVPFVARVREEFPSAVLSVDTWRPAVALACLELGVHVINDAWGGFDPKVAEVAGRFGAGIVCTHAGGASPRTYPHRVEYDDVTSDVIMKTVALAETAVAKGVPRESILLDPGHDFYKNCRHSLLVTRELSRLVETGWPVLVAMSNKKFLGEVLDLEPSNRFEATIAANTIAAWLGARVFRVHQVRECRRALQVVAAIQGRQDLAVARRGLA